MSGDGVCSDAGDFGDLGMCRGVFGVLGARLVATTSHTGPVPHTKTRPADVRIIAHVSPHDTIVATSSPMPGIGTGVGGSVRSRSFFMPRLYLVSSWRGWPSVTSIFSPWRSIAAFSPVEAFEAFESTLDDFFSMSGFGRIRSRLVERSAVSGENATLVGDGEDDAADAGDRRLVDAIGIGNGGGGEPLTQRSGQLNDGLDAWYIA